MTAPVPASGTAGSGLVQAAREFAASPEGREVAASGPLDWILLGLATVAVAAVVVLCARYFLQPDEPSADHIKRRVLRDEVERPHSG